LNTEQLKTFLSVAETGNFSLTAKQMILAQSTVSKRIRELEGEAGQALFERGRSGATLTQAGKSLLEYAGRIVSMEEKALEQIKRTSRFEGHLVLGTAYAYFDVTLQIMLERFLALHPEISVRVVFGHSGSILAACRQARVDIGFSHHPYDHPEYLCQLVDEDEVVLVTGGRNRALRGGVPHARIKDLPFLSSNFLYASTHSWLFPRNQQFQLEVDVARHALPFLKTGNWVTLLPRKMVREELDAGTLLEIPIVDGAIPPVRTHRVVRRDGVAQGAVRAWLSFSEGLGLPADS